jgi:hypothetical protein
MISVCFESDDGHSDTEMNADDMRHYLDQDSDVLLTSTENLARLE